MQDVGTTIMQYQTSIEQAQVRIDQLTTLINKARTEGRAVKEYLDRRYLLYTEVVDMQYAVSRLKEFLRAPRLQI